MSGARLNLLALHLLMKNRLAALRLVLLATLSWCAGAMFAVMWAWLYGLQLTRPQAQFVVVAFAVLGLVYGVLQVLRGKTGEPVDPSE